MSVQTDSAVPDEMRAVVLRGPGDWGMETVESPAVDDVENVVCKVKGSAICGTDPKILSGEIGMRIDYPFTPGHEWAGEVVEVHESVDRFDVGDRVFAETHSGCGFCRMCRQGRYNLCENYGDFSSGHRQVGHTMDGAFAEYVSVPADCLYHLDDDISWQEGALLDTTGIALQCTVRGDIEPGDSVAVVGTGTLGLLMVQQAAIRGASQIIAIGNPEKNKVARDLGATHAISYHDDDVVEQVREITPGTDSFDGGPVFTGAAGVDVVLEAVGKEETVRQAVKMARRGGTISADGPPGDCDGFPVSDIVLQELDFRGARAHANKSEACAAMVGAGQIDLEPLITHEFDLVDFPDAYEAATDPDEDAIRVVMTN